MCRRAPNQTSPSTSVASPGSNALQPPLGPELEERICLQPRLLGLLVLPGGDGRLHAVERERDQVVVGLVGRLLPACGIVARQAGPRCVRERLDLGAGRTPSFAGRLVDDCRPARSTAILRRGGAAVALGHCSWRSAERGSGARVEGDRLLDLEVERDAVVLDAAAVLDRDEREEAQQLLRAARRLLGRERRGGEALERAGDLVARGAEAAAPSTGGARRERGEPAPSASASAAPRSSA